ncbi:MAG: glycosyltransferase family 4 protein [Tannerella sp.]|nr:glycosyltransferase family 4 protein [Tannerella sp.]
MAKTRQSYLKGMSPSYHQFGTNELMETGEYVVDYLLVAPKKSNSRILKIMSLLPVWLKAYRKARKYDYVYGAADFTVDFMGFMKKIGLFKPKLLTIFHHPPFKLRLKIATYDQIIFLCEFAFKEMTEAFPRLKERMLFMQWGPDLHFYRKYAPLCNFEKIHKKIVFISNGKTHRDHEILLEAAEFSGNHAIIVCDEKTLPANYNQEKCNYTSIFYQNKPDDIKMVELLSNCSVLVIPTYPSDKRLGPIGLTSFLDAVAMGIPIITANNTVLTDIVEREKMGFVYEAGNVNDLCDKMNRFVNEPELIISCGKNAAEFGLTNNIKEFGKQLKKQIEIM